MVLDLDAVFGDEDVGALVEKQRPVTDLEPDAFHDKGPTPDSGVGRNS